MAERVLEGHVIYHFTPDMEPAWRVRPGERVTVRCPDGMRGRIKTEQDHYVQVDPDKVNDAVGPIYVEGAHPGDALAVRLEEVRVPADQGYVLLIPGFGLLQDRVHEPRTKICRIDEGGVHFNDLVLPVKPCIGTIGVAPGSGRISTLYPGDHGGNMDTTDVTTGATLYLPVGAEGGLLAMGDGKAVMGDGEVCGTGVGVPLDIDLSCDVVPRSWIKRPVLANATHWMTVCSAPDLEGAVRLAVEDMTELLMRSRGLSFEEAYMLCSLVGDLKISQVVDPWMTVRMAVPREVVGEAALTLS
jgi:amidase